jgi:hypothetical protein
MQRHRGHSLRSPRKRLRDVLAVYLVCFLGIAPVLQLAHLAATDHGHRFCHEHDRFEDLPYDSMAVRNGAVAAPSAAEGQSSATSGVPGPRGELHIACLFLNHGASRSSLPSPAPILAAVEEGQGFVPEGQQSRGFLPCPLLRSAPKTSPPLVVA